MTKFIIIFKGLIIEIKKRIALQIHCRKFLTLITKFKLAQISQKR